MLQTMLQPLLFVFIFGQVMIRSGIHAVDLQGDAAAGHHGDEHAA